MEKEQVINYLFNLSDKERAQIWNEIRELDRVRDEQQYELNKKKYEEEKKRKQIRGEQMKKIVKPGMFVQCEGTRDGLGLREVLEVGEHRITARKITRSWNKNSGKKWARDTYITTHEWNKIVRIVDNISL